MSASPDGLQLQEHRREMPGVWKAPVLMIFLLLLVPSFVAGQSQSVSIHPTGKHAEGVTRNKKQLPTPTTRSSTNQDIPEDSARQGPDAKGPLVASGSLQVHIAEYNAITTRNTYLMTMEYSLLGALLVYLPIAATVLRRTKDDRFIWFALMGLMLFGIWWSDISREMMNNTLYLEKTLRTNHCCPTQTKI